MPKNTNVSFTAGYKYNILWYDFARITRVLFVYMQKYSFFLQSSSVKFPSLDIIFACLFLYVESQRDSIFFDNLLSFLRFRKTIFWFLGFVFYVIFFVQIHQKQLQSRTKQTENYGLSFLETSKNQDPTSLQMGPSKIQLKVQHKNHEKQTKQSKVESIQKQKSQKKIQKSGARLGKSKSKEKIQQKSVAQQSSLKDQKIRKSKSKDKNQNKLKEKSSEKKDRKADKKKDKSQKEKKKNKQQKSDKNDKKNKKGKHDKKSKKSKGESEEENEKLIAKSRSKRELDKQLETISSINKETAKAKLTIGELIELYKDASYDIFVNHGHNSQKQKEIEEDLLRLQQQKEKRRKRLEELDKSAEEKKRQREIELEQSEKKKKQKIIQKRKRAISLRLQSLASQALKRKQQHLKFQQYATQRRSQQPRYKKYQKPFLQLSHALQQQQQQILQQRKLKAAPTDYEQLQRFMESYEQQKMQALEHLQKKMELQKRLVEQENQWMGKLYKGSAYVEMEKQEKRNILVEQHQTAKEKLQRTKDYGKMVKSQFIIGHDNNQDEQYDGEGDSRINYNSQDVRYREKHILGKSLGLVPQKRVKPLTHEQKLKMGVSYLQQLRKLPRKGLKSTGDTNAHTIQHPQKSSRVIGGTYIMKKPTNPFYSLQRSGTSFDAKNKREIELTLEQVKSKDQSTVLQQKALRYMQYAGVTELQKKHADVNRRLIGDISSKLDILKKLVD